MSDIKLLPCPDALVYVEASARFMWPEMQDYARQCVLADRAVRADEKFLTPSTLSDYAATHMLLTDVGIPIFAEDGVKFTLRDRVLLLIG